MLGHRRLSIIDLSPSGHQPMISAAGDAALILNGEIYNYLELKSELLSKKIPITWGSDAGVLLEALRTWKTDSFCRLNGMWALAFWQPEENRLILCRDRFGVKPLYYHLGENGIYFASEPKALLELLPRLRKVNEPALMDFLANGRLYARNESFYEGIRLVPPAHYAEYDVATGTLKFSRYWDYPKERAENCRDAAEQFAAIFDDAVRLRLRSDVPAGVMLSGGLDSSAVLAAARKSWSSPLTCFTSVYDAKEMGEYDWARCACEPYGLQPAPVPAPKDKWLDELPKIAWHMDGPGYSPAVYPLWCLVRESRARSIPVLLEGQGGDELLAGYPQYSALELLGYVRGAGEDRRSWAGLKSRLKGMHHSFKLRWSLLWMAREAFPALLPFHRRHSAAFGVLREDLQKMSSASIPIPEKGFDPLTSRLLADHSREILPGLLHYGDAISMAHAIEARQPFLDYRLVELVFRLPSRFKLHDGQTKWMLRNYLRENGQTRIGNRLDKRGYPTPAVRWLADSESRILNEVLLDPGARILQWCDHKRLNQYIMKHKGSMEIRGHHLYRLLSTEIWLRTCVKP